MTGKELAYRRGTLSVEELDREVAAFWAELAESAELRAEVAAHGVPPRDVLAVPPGEAVRFRVEGAGLDASHIALVVALAPAANHALTSLWDTVVLPWIRGRRGEDAVRDAGPRSVPEAGDDGGER
ncbi:hypothetical protein AB0M28_13870 [Streptomyces sp. NPDC051940]|uniref:hypothetical protein n=1 Tax=Streptomyces sp. NPDC051940 TaxID=3155675 RepID=UPI003432B69E